MTKRTLDLPAEVQSKLVYLGADGARWLSELPGFVRGLEHEWNITVGAVVNGGSEALVAQVTTADGGDAIGATERKLQSSSEGDAVYDCDHRFRR